MSTENDHLVSPRERENANRCDIWQELLPMAKTVADALKSTLQNSPAKDLVPKLSIIEEPEAEEGAKTQKGSEMPEPRRDPENPQPRERLDLDPRIFDPRKGNKASTNIAKDETHATPADCNSSEEVHELVALGLTDDDKKWITEVLPKASEAISKILTKDKMTAEDKQLLARVFSKAPSAICEQALVWNVNNALRKPEGNFPQINFISDGNFRLIELWNASNRQPISQAPVHPFARYEFKTSASIEAAATTGDKEPQPHWSEPTLGAPIEKILSQAEQYLHEFKSQDDIKNKYYPNQKPLQAFLPKKE